MVIACNKKNKTNKKKNFIKIIVAYFYNFVAVVVSIFVKAKLIYHFGKFMATFSCIANTICCLVLIFFFLFITGHSPMLYGQKIFFPSTVVVLVLLQGLVDFGRLLWNILFLLLLYCPVLHLLHCIDFLMKNCYHLRKMLSAP